jgi:hypothetical protein
MPLNISINEGGEFAPYLKYNAKAGRWYVKRTEGASGEVEVVAPRLVFDFDNIKTGWIHYPTGAAPVKIWNNSATGQFMPKPSDGRSFKQGFEVMVFGPDTVPGAGKIGLREFNSVAANCVSAIDSLFVVYEGGRKENPGKLPFFQCIGVDPVSGAYGTNYEPRFKLLAWVERSKIPEFDAHYASHPAPQAGAPIDPQAPLAPFGAGPITHPDYAPDAGDRDLNDPIPF